LQIEKIYHELESGDFRICAYIVQSLVETAEGRGCDLRRNNAAFQLAVCYSFGFGVLGDDAIARRWLDLSGRPWADLQDVLQRMKDHSAMVPITSDLREKGYSNDLAHRYSQDGVLSKALVLYKAMVNCRENVFGPSHSSTLRMRSTLIDLLRWNGESEDAVAMALENLRHTGLGEVPLVDHLASKARLARAYLDMGLVDRAEQIQREVLAGYVDSSHSDHAFRLAAQIVLAEILASKGMFREAAELSQDAERRCSLALGELHPSYTDAIRVLAWAYDGIVDLEKAISKGEHVEFLSRRNLPKDHPVLIQDMTTQGIRYYRYQDHERARGYYQTIEEAIQRKPANAIPAVRTATASAFVLYRSGRADEASKILEALLSEAKRVLGVADKDVASVMRALGKIYCEKKEYGEAETILRQALEADPLVRGRLNKSTLVAATTLAQCIAFQGRWLESAQRDMETLLVVQNTPYLTDSDEIGIIMRAARSFTYAKAWAEAIPLLEKEVLWGKSQEEGRPIKYLCTLALAGICHWRLGQPTKTLELIREILDGLQTPFEEDPNELISCLVSLGKRCMEKSSFADAGQLLGGSMLLAAQLPEVSQHAKQMVNGAISGFLAQGRPKEELEFHPSVLSSAEEQN
jgi:tetratricopeptide (TPR) repeat protein